LEWQLAADDYGTLRMRRFPTDAPGRGELVLDAHPTGSMVPFALSAGDGRIVSVGARDRSIAQWVVEPCGSDDPTLIPGSEDLGHVDSRFRRASKTGGVRSLVHGFTGLDLSLGAGPEGTKLDLARSIQRAIHPSERLQSVAAADVWATVADALASLAAQPSSFADAHAEQMRLLLHPKPAWTSSFVSPAPATVVPHPGTLGRGLVSIEKMKIATRPSFRAFPGNGYTYHQEPRLALAPISITGGCVPEPLRRGSSGVSSPAAVGLVKLLSDGSIAAACAHRVIVYRHAGRAVSGVKLWT